MSFYQRAGAVWCMASAQIADGAATSDRQASGSAQFFVVYMVVCVS